MKGFSPHFLGCEKLVYLPESNLAGHKLIHYQNFSVYFNINRKLALYSASNNRKFSEKIDRRKFRKDRRNLKPENQLGQEFYYSKTIDKSSTDKSNVVDRGHLAAKHYVDWGKTIHQAKKASDDSFYFTNVTPQYWKINQSPGAWNLLEKFVMDKLNGIDVSVISGQILSEDDPVLTFENKYTGKKDSLLIPLKFWKVVYYNYQDTLKRIAFVIRQDVEIMKLSFVSRDYKMLKKRVKPDPFDLMSESLKTYIVNPKIIEKSTNLKFHYAVDYYNQRESDKKFKPRFNNSDKFVDLDSVDIQEYL